MSKHDFITQLRDRADGKPGIDMSEEKLQMDIWQLYTWLYGLLDRHIELLEEVSQLRREAASRKNE
ncbi:MAG: hypothetical protein GY906_28435 [bacterium]|nr:hypothetical protein [bacterium]